jgi:Ca-activated chloride channel family protein
MIFSNLKYAHFFWLAPLLIIFYLWAFRNRHKALETFAQQHLIPLLTSTVNWRSQKLKAVMSVLAVCLMIFALIGPRWGAEWHEVKREGIDIIVAIDTSRSMLAQDVKPNRLERSKLAVEELLDLLQGDRIGLVAFAGNSFLQCPLTLDYGAFSIALNAIDTEIIPRGGTSISSAIETAITAFEGKAKKYKAMILITDGEYHEGDPEEAAKKAAELGIKIFCVGVGTREGELIPVVDENGRTGFLKDRRGRVVQSQLDETSLQKIALTTGGGYVHASGAEYGLDIIYNEKIATMEKKELGSKLQKRYEERYQIPAFIALGLLCLEVFLAERMSGRRLRGKIKAGRS